MRYESTRDKKIKIHSAVAVMKGISDEGGLFVPETIPKFSSGEIQSFVGKSYVKIAQTILSKYFTDFTESELADCIQFAYSGDNKKSSGKFGSERITPVVKLDDGKNFAYLLELWHGPTCAFKDIALQLMPRLMTCAMKKIENQKETGFSDKEAVVLVATSGDTGKAALEGFMDVENTRILVFYPADGVSELQKLQMTTQAGKNVAAYGVYGNFDDAQTAVKEIFTDRTMKETLKNANKIFSSANSINWGRLSPQIVYYAAAYCELLEKGELQPGENINFVVPTGNFGNIL
ncbi:MAG: pyridoxal-phosphate dependent enzyme, partial [Oscillospiraceae bacterium]|nr:pyridoxal-phosphate dependent enzyme [Oscillospiraceae bacterium]